MAQRTFAFVMDPIERVNIHADTTFAFMLEAQRRGHRVVYVSPAGLELVHEKVQLRGQVVELAATVGAHVRVVESVVLDAAACTAVFIRTDPPFDQDYLTATWILSFAERAGVRIVNSPSGLRRANEKLYALEFPELCPETLITSSRVRAREFLDRVHDAIAKPIDGHGGLGVFRLRDGDSNVFAIIDHLTFEGRRPIVVQRFLPAISGGDKRLMLIDGVLRGCVRRVPAAGEHRGNVHVGGRVEAAEPSVEDQQIAKAVAPKLREQGLFFVGLDVIGDRLIEVNVTSPTLVQELKRLGGPDLAAEMITAVGG